MIQASKSILINPDTGNLAFRILPFGENLFDHVQRNNFYSLIWIQRGSGILRVDFSDYRFGEQNLLAFSPYQPFMLKPEHDVAGIALHFHPDFFCIHKHHQEVACHGVLFNNIYQPPLVMLDGKSIGIFEMLIPQMQSEMQQSALARNELLISYLKIFLITASRLKAEQQMAADQLVADRNEPFVLQSLKDAIEAHYKDKHAAGDYAAMLNITPKALARITKTHLHKTPTALISERIIIEAKRELYLTNKPVKQIAYELGYDDEHYFSRFFKTNTEISPQIYRNSVGYNRQSS